MSRGQRRDGDVAGDLGGDAGLTLVELTVAMIVASVAAAVMAAMVLNLTDGTRRVRAGVDAQAATRDAFLQLDKQIRYADAVTAPGTVSGVQYIEWRVPDPSIPVATSVTQSRCYQWRAASGTGLLQTRSWVVPTTGAVTAPAWRTVASGLVVGSQPVFTVDATALAAAPFNLPAAGDGALPYARVGVWLSVRLGSPAGTSGTVSVFSAVNSSAATSAVCGQVPRS